MTPKKKDMSKIKSFEVKDSLLKKMILALTSNFNTSNDFRKIIYILYINFQKIVS